MNETGFEYHSDELVVFPLDAEEPPSAFYRPLKLRHDALAALEADGYVQHDVPRLDGDDKLQLRLPMPSSPHFPRPGLILFPTFTAGIDLRLRVLDAGATALRLLENNLNGENLADGGLARLARLAKDVPAFTLEYGDTFQLERVFRDFLTGLLDKSEDAETLRQRYLPFSTHVAVAAPVTTQEQDFPLNEPTPGRGTFPLTIGMATYDDFDGVYFTLQSLRFNNPDLAADIEFLIIDNNPTGRCAKDLKKLENVGKNVRYVPFAGQSGTTVRDFVMSEATGTFVMCMDCHVLLAPGALERLIDWLRDNPDCTDLLQGPLIYDGLDTAATHFEPVWREGMYGTWADSIPRPDMDGEAFEIPMQGLGLFACRKDAWPGFNTYFRGFGGEEGYIHEKFRQRGDRTLCLPFLQWVHRFARPMGIPYKPSWEDRIRNYMIGFRELGLDESGVIDHFNTHVGKGFTGKVAESVEAELNNPFTHFGMMSCINLDRQTERWQQMRERFVQVGIDGMVKRFPAIATPESHHIGCALSHRAIIADARQRGAGSVLVFEDDTIFRDDIFDHMPALLEDLDRVEWDILFLGGHAWDQSFDLAPGCKVLQKVSGVTACQSIAYHARAFDRLLDDMPDTHEGMAEWLKTHVGIDQYLARSDLRAYLPRPLLCIQPPLLSIMPEEERLHFTA